MKFRISPFWWPLLAATSPLSVPLLSLRAARFFKVRKQAERLNAERMDAARPLDFPALKSMDITVVVEEKTVEGFHGDSGVSYLIRTDLGSLLMDVGFGPEHPAFPENTSRLGLTMDDADALLITHLHLDHMGGMTAMDKRTVAVPSDFLTGPKKPCFVPDECRAPGFDLRFLDTPAFLTAGLATTGPLARSLFFRGLTEEQAVVGRLEGKGLVVLTGCGHPTIEVILKMVRRLSAEPIYAIGGGLHFPITKSRSARLGLEVQRIFGTGKPFWDPINDEDLTRTIQALNEAAPKRLFLSGHDTCDHALDRLSREVDAKVEVFQAGRTYTM